MKQEIIAAVRKLACLSFYPPPEGREGLMDLFERMIATPEQLEWLVRTLIDRVGTYPGPMEIRGIFCHRFRPKDGIEAYGEWRYKFGTDCEAEAIAQSNAFKALPPPSLIRQITSGLPELVDGPEPPALPPVAIPPKPLTALEAELREQARQRTLTEEQKNARLIEIVAKLNLSIMPD